MVMLRFTLFFTHPASPTGATKQVQLTQYRSLPSPSHQGGKVWSTVSDGVGISDLA